MLNSIKHSIVLLQIAKNTAHPITGFYQGPVSSFKQDDGKCAGCANLNKLKRLNCNSYSQPDMFPSVVPLAATGIGFGSECIESLSGIMRGFSVARILNFLVACNYGNTLFSITLICVGVVGFTPETSYSSSENEDDFFDANDDPYSNQDKSSFR